jgi:hypothetical protein
VWCLIDITSFVPINNLFNEVEQFEIRDDLFGREKIINLHVRDEIGLESGLSWVPKNKPLCRLLFSYEAPFLFAAT